MGKDNEEYKNKDQSSEEEEEFIEENDDSKKAVKKQKIEKAGEKRKRETNKDDKGDQIFELSAKRRVTVRLFSTGEPSVDIREFYKDKNTGEMRPGKAGICFPLAQWHKLKELIPDIDEAIEAIKKK
ncbi:hypothetical protein G6F46_010928 [Rhizopus delemar]|uniref:Transcriptional coactivator p15 (PC4) C-terminal domain-containing protein n=3 Tax=Rhizopus TaxID=4842 RepID=I1BNG6_RHIO9|nr:hypothetical protein RO3G_02450 [Rhizopus delemar RA 99-880]KAG1046728.1 hypothetical protein G6F43_010800 [Rhizopus delemar]KAG1537728.1 hypothetical protein G6F51_010199 [Rhizopus arrhizus]KAG1447999.1 hypothetical protein G6F55_010851 [Rhizopus delemar]KAG1491541.1 hypothetical protein G6F54_009942 [Rhizopus delemar]|eukprot:EIE77746.1 hypothetical protein RO3G_02450 [Rhizopus delemar RA 99-880]